MSPTGLVYSHFTIYKNPATPGDWPIPAAGATVAIYRQGATVTSQVEVHEHDTVTVPVKGRRSTSGWRQRLRHRGC